MCGSRWYRKLLGRISRTERRCADAQRFEVNDGIKEDPPILPMPPLGGEDPPLKVEVIS